MREWRTAFRDASFRGVSFKVLSDSPQGGRRVGVHDISGGEAPVTEDLGRATREVYVEAYVVGDAADYAGLALEAACDAAGPGLLILPMDAGWLMHCVRWIRNREKDRAGYIAYDLDFVEAGSGVSAIGDPVAALRNVFDAAAGAVSAAIGRLF